MEQEISQQFDMAFNSSMSFKEIHVVRTVHSVRSALRGSSSTNRPETDESSTQVHTNRAVGGAANLTLYRRSADRFI
jgi:hypothetical protein